MLRLSVNKDEYLMVGPEVKITFLGGNDKTLRLMIDAPKEVNVARGKAIKKRAAARAAAAVNADILN
ncbi:MAG: carbon storage regulator [Lachnospiraceae bacterium]|nr:carbon storage regulator [Lachnospiraceae bacterium]